MRQQSVESLFARLEPLLPQVQKPIQYVGGELNSTVKDWDACDVRWALMYPDAYEVGLPNQGVMILYEVLNEQDGILAERTYSGVAGPRSADARARRAAVHRRRPPAGRRVRRARACRFATELGYTNMLHRARPRRHPAAARGPRRRATRSSSPAATRRSTPSRSPTSSTPRSSATASRPCSRSATSSAPGRPRAGPAAATSCCCGSRRPAASTSRASTTSTTCPTGASSGSRPTAPACRGGSRKHTVMDLDEWPYPKQPLVPLAETVHERMSRRDLPRLHARLPVLPGGHDHPPGARALDHRHRRDGRARPAGHRLRGGRPAVAVQRRPLRDRADDQGPRRPLRGHPDLAVAAVDPRRRVQHRPGQRAHPQRPPLRSDVRARGRQRAHPQGHQQDGHRGRPDPHRHRGLRRRLAAGEALLHVRPADRDRRGRPADRRPGEEGHRRPAARSPARATSAARCRSAASCPSRTRRSSGPAQLDHEATDARLAKLRDAIRADRQFAKAIGFRYHDGKPGIVEGLLSRGDRRVGEVIQAVCDDGGRFDGWSEHFSFDRWMAAADAGAGRRAGRRRLVHHARARPRRGAARGTTSTPGSTRTGCGRTGRTRSPRPRSTTAAGRRASTAASARRWAPRSRSGPTGATLLPLTVLNSARDRILADVASGVSEQHDGVPRARPPRPCWRTRRSGNSPPDPSSPRWGVSLVLRPDDAAAAAPRRRSRHEVVGGRRARALADRAGSARRISPSATSSPTATRCRPTTRWSCALRRGRVAALADRRAVPGVRHDRPGGRRRARCWSPPSRATQSAAGSGRWSTAELGADGRHEAGLVPRRPVVVDPAALRRAGRRPGRPGRLGRGPSRARPRPVPGTLASTWSATSTTVCAPHPSRSRDAARRPTGGS